MRVAYFGPWIGEFGWELMAWQAWCRQESRKYDKSYACSFPDMAPLYSDFAEFIPHHHPARALDWRDISKVDYEIPEGAEHIKPVKTYRLGGEFIRFGEKMGDSHDILIHARNISRSSGKNYSRRYWSEIVGCLEDRYAISCIGTTDDMWIENAADMRGFPLALLMNVMANSRLVVGQSSGVMHLASLCGTPHIVWGDSRTYFGETLEKRYKETWNPLNTPVEYIYDDNWQPKPEHVIEAIERWMGMDDKFELDVNDMMLEHLERAMASGQWMITVNYKNADGGLQHAWQTSDFPKADMLPSMERLKADMYIQEQIDAAIVTRNETAEDGTTPPEEETGWH